jgi:hypothetical protein
MSREEVLRRLEAVQLEIARLKKELQEDWPTTEGHDRTSEFLEKCTGWEDDRAPEEVIAEIYSSRTSSNGGELQTGEDPR